MDSVVRIPAVLHGSGVASECILEAWQELSSRGRVFIRCRITDDAPQLPDGTYELEFDNHSVRTRKAFGVWDLVFLPSEIRVDIRRWSESGLG